MAPAALALEVLGERGRGWTRAARVEPTLDERTALGAVSALWDAIARGAHEPPKRFSVTGSRLAPWPPRQGELFARGDDRVQGLLETVRGRFGARAISLDDSADRTARYTGLKISFEHIPDIADFEWLGIEMPRVP